MATKDAYTSLIAEIEGRGGFTTVRSDEHGGYNLVCASRKTEEGALGGNSFWVWFCKKLGAWYLSTWSPCHYVIPRYVDLAELCMECLSLSAKAIPSVPDATIAKFSLIEVSDDDFDSLYQRDLGQRQ
jgi:hypothetical protein